MKILKIFGIVAALHVVAFVLIFANPGCQSKGTAASAPPDTATAPTPATVSYPGPAPSADGAALTPAAVDPNAPLNNAALNPGVAPAGSATVSFNGGELSNPTRPGTPLAQALTSAPTTGVVPASTYTVGHGDSLWSVAKKHHVSVSELAKANNLKTTSSLRLGQKLIIPGGRVSTAPAASSGGRASSVAAAAPAAATTERAGEVVHVVRAGETLGAIARHYQVSLGDLATANNISDPAKIRPGQKLVIPGFKAVGAKGKKQPAEAPAAASAVAPAPTPVNPAVAPAPQVLDSGSPPPAAGPDDAPVIKVDNSGASAPQLN